MKVIRKLKECYFDVHNNSEKIYRGCGAVLSYLMSGEIDGKSRVTNEKMASDIGVNEKTISRMRNKDIFNIREILEVALYFNLDYSVSIQMIQYSKIEWYYGAKNYDEYYDEILMLANSDRNFSGNKYKFLHKK